MSPLFEIKADQLAALSADRQEVFLTRTADELRSAFPSWAIGSRRSTARGFVDAIAQLAEQLEIHSEDAIVRLAWLSAQHGLVLPWSPRLMQTLAVCGASSARRVDAFERTLILYERETILIDLETDIASLRIVYE